MRQRSKSGAAPSSSQSAHSEVGTASHREGREFREQIANMFLRNEFSGVKAQQTLQNAAKAGAKKNVGDLARAGASGRQPGNAARDLTKLLLKGKDLPSLYWASIPLMNKGTNAMEDISLPFLLPHEVFAKMSKSIRRQEVRQRLEPQLQTMLEDMCESLRVPLEEVSPLGMHGDGVPHQKNQTMECFTWNFLGFPGAERILAACVEKRFCCSCGCSGRHTTTNILEVLTWSFRCMADGKFPDRRHDGTPWGPDDKARSELAGSLGGRGFFVPSARGLELVQASVRVPQLERPQHLLEVQSK